MSHISCSMALSIEILNMQIPIMCRSVTQVSLRPEMIELSTRIIKYLLAELI